MGMLDRYKKSGGFVQLLQLIETCGPQKQEKLLKVVESEDPRWSRAIQGKMLSVERIFSWDDDTLAELMSRLHELTLAVAIHAFDDVRKQKAFRSFTPGRRRNIEDLAATKDPNAAEIATAYSHIIAEVRDLIKQGYVRLEKVDPELAIEENIEEKIISSALDIEIMDNGSFSTESAEEIVSSVSGAPQQGDLWKGDRETVERMTKKIVALNKENQLLKTEIRNLRDKLDQIKRIA